MSEIDPNFKEMSEQDDMYFEVSDCIKSKKTIAVPAANVPEKIRKQVGRNWIAPKDLLTTDFIYVDKEGNITRVDVILNKIASISFEDRYVDPESQFKNKLAELGFEKTEKAMESKFFSEEIEPLIDEQQGEIGNKRAAQRKSDFDF